MTDKVYACIDGIECIEVEAVDNTEYDIVVLTLKKDVCNAKKLLIKRGFDEKQIVLARIFLNLGLELDRYLELLRSDVSIISRNCAGGLLSHRYGLAFNSPTVNTRIAQKDFYRYVYNIEEYLECEIECMIDDRGGIKGQLKDVTIFFPHAESCEKAYLQWMKRQARLNMDNIFILSFADNEEELAAFKEISYNGICVTSFKTKCEKTFTPKDLNSALYYNDASSMTNRLAQGGLRGVDWLNTLLDGRIVLEKSTCYL